MELGDLTSDEIVALLRDNTDLSERELVLLDRLHSALEEVDALHEALSEKRQTDLDRGAG